MFRQLKGRAYRELLEREARDAGKLDSQTDDLNGFPRYMPEHDQTFPLTGPCNAYDRDEADSD